MGEEKTRKYGLDFLKGIAACFVVFMHAKFPDMFGYYMSMIGRTAVPIFFMTSGYFSYQASKGKLRRSIKRTAYYILVAYVLATIAKIIELNFDLNEINQYFNQSIFTTDHMLRLVFITDTRLSGVAWFLLSLLICYVFKYFLGLKLRYLAYLGLAVRVLGAIQFPFLGMTIPVNTPWVTGIPFFVIGELFHENKDYIENRLSLLTCSLIGIIGFLILVVPIFHGSLWWFIGTLLLSPSLFVLFSRMDMKFNKFCLMGSVYAFFIYIVHPLIGRIYDAVRIDISTTESWLRPLIILTITILLAVSYYGLKRVFVKR